MYRSGVSAAAVVPVLCGWAEPIPVPTLHSRQDLVRAKRGPPVHLAGLIHGSRLSQTRTRADAPLLDRGRLVGIAPLPAADPVPSACCDPGRVAHIHVSVCTPDQCVQ